MSSQPKPNSNTYDELVNRPVFVTYEGKEDFFVRKEGYSMPLNRAEQHEWSKDRW